MWYVYIDDVIDSIHTSRRSAIARMEALLCQHVEDVRVEYDGGATTT